MWGSALIKISPSELWIHHQIANLLCLCADRACFMRKFTIFPLIPFDFEFIGLGVKR
jgi:hypothetical protein